MVSDVGRDINDDVWLSGGPNFSGNIVVAGHRFRYSNPLSTPFYFLDQLKIGEEIIFKYENISYLYQVVKVFEVGEEEVWIKGDYTFPSITLYTCTPIYNPKNRLVVVGRLVSIE